MMSSVLGALAGNLEPISASGVTAARHQREWAKSPPRICHFAAPCADTKMGWAL